MNVEREFPGPYWWLGKVVNREDPEGIYRIKAKIPGKIDETDWASPFGFTTGSKRGGGPRVPLVGAPVALFWFGGEKNGTVGYLPGMFFRGQVPTGTVVSNDAEDNFIWQNDQLRVEIDSRPSSAGLKVTNLSEIGGVDQAGSAVSLELDIATGQAKLASTLGLKIEAVGAVEIVGGSVTINGRLVTPGSKPI